MEKETPLELARPSTAFGNISRQRILRHYGWWILWLGAVPVASQIPTQLDSLANAAQLHVPAVFLSGSRDTIVPPRFHRMVYDAYAGPKRLIMMPGSGHNDFPDPATLSDYKAALDWLWPPSAPDSPPINSAMPPPSAQIK